MDDDNALFLGLGWGSSTAWGSHGDGRRAHHDDGLVHGHGWAREQPRHRGPSPVRAGHGAAAANGRPAPQADFDEGLVHGHSWACGERGRPRH